MCEYIKREHTGASFAWWTTYTIAILIIASYLRAFENIVHETSNNNLLTVAHLHDRLEIPFSVPRLQDP